MKKHCILIAFACTIILYSCKSTPENINTATKEPAINNQFIFDPSDSVEINIDSLTKPEEKIPINIAKKWISNYQQYLSTLHKKNEAGEFIPLDQSEKLNSFTYQTEDLLSALGIEKTILPVNVPHIRGYIGITHAKPPFTYKLLFVAAINANLDKKQGALSAGKDAFFIAQKKGAMKESYENEGFVLDLNYPCPTLCFTDDIGIKQY